MKEIKDIIHGIITIDQELLNIIDTPIFQRLGRVKQLTSAEYVFPGSRHTRKEHCIGAMFLATKYSQVLNLNDDDKKVIEIAALLHDIGHGSFSHSYDSIIYILLYPGTHKGHDKHRHYILDNYFPSLKYKDSIKNVWNGKDKVLSAILNGPLSVDRIDFVRRDTFYTGTEHFGYIDADRIINSASIYTKEDGTRVLAYDEKIISDAIQGLTSRLYMYNKVYLHKTVIAAAILIEAALKSSVECLELVEKTKNLDDFIHITDSILDIILSSKDPELEQSKSYIKRLYSRDLPKMVSEDIIYLTPEIKTKHLPGITIDQDKIYWVGRVLTNDFASEFDKYDIHINNNKNEYIPFRDFWREKYPFYQIETYYIKRIYKL